MRNEHLSRLRMMTRDRQMTWDLSPNDVAAIRYALSEIERLNAELANARAMPFKVSAIVFVGYNDVIITDDGDELEVNLKAHGFESLDDAKAFDGNLDREGDDEGAYQLAEWTYHPKKGTAPDA